MIKKLFFCTAIFLPSLLIASFCSGQAQNEMQKVRELLSGKEFQFEEIDGIGFEKGVTRRDNSDVITVGNKYYVYYNKVYGRSPGYWGTVWAAVSEDEGYSCIEVGEVLGRGKNKQWDSKAVFTPNILKRMVFSICITLVFSPHLPIKRESSKTTL